MKIKALVWALPLVLFLAVAAFLMTRLGQDPTTLPSARLGKPFPNFAVTDLDGKPVSLADIKG